MDEFDVIFDPLRNRVEDLTKLSKAYDESLCPQMKETLIEAAHITLAEMRDFHQATKTPPAELSVFPGGKH